MTTYYVCHGPEVVHYIEVNEGSTLLLDNLILKPLLMRLLLAPGLKSWAMCLRRNTSHDRRAP